MQDVGAGPVAIDTAVFIYLIEEHPLYLPLVEPLFTAIDAGRLRAVTSSLTLLEVLVVPLRAGDALLAARYEAALTHTRGLRLLEIDRHALRAAAALRAAYPRLRTPDALPRDWPAPAQRLPELRVLDLASYVEG